MLNLSKKLEPIVIDLTLPLISGNVKTANLLQVQAKSRLDELLVKFVQSSDLLQGPPNKKSWAREFDTQRFNNTIFISGQRGAGKTTFLRTVLLEKFNDDLDGILPVAFIDPTLVETHQHILIDIIAKFKQLVSEQLSCCGDEKKHKEFTKRLEALAEGLKLLGRTNIANDQDAAWFLNKALKHAVGGQTLEAKFHELIDTVAEILEQKLFIIAIDDVDTDTSKAYEVLELIRRYLTHPKLAVIISGDPSLYSHIVQGKKIQELSSNHQGFKGTEQYEKNTTKLVEHLEQQYLAKVLPIEQRVELKNLNDLLHATNTERQPSIQVKESTGTTTEISVYMTKFLTNNLNLNEKYLSSYIQFMLTQPVRSILQILKNTIEQSNYFNSSEALKTSIINSYIGALRKEDMNLDSLTGSSLHANSVGLAQFNLCNKYGELETGFYARPDGNNESYNVSQIFLSTVISSYLTKDRKSSIGRAFQLMITSGATCNVYMNNVANDLKVGRTSEDYINYIGLNREQNMFSLAAHFSPFVWGSNNSKKISSGIIRIPRRSQKKFNDADFKTLLSTVFVNRELDIKRLSSIGNLEKYYTNSNVNFLEYLAAKSILISSHSMMTKNEGRDYVSSYCFIASLSELLITDKLDDKLSQLSSVQTFGFPAFVNIQGEGDEISLEDTGSTSSANSNDFDDKLIALLGTWKYNNSKNRKEFSSLLVGKVWARVMYTLTSISEKAAKDTVIYIGQQKHDVLLGTVFSRFIWGMINATIIEEIRYSKEINPVLVRKIQNAKNVTTSPTELINSLIGVIDEVTPNGGTQLQDIMLEVQRENNFKDALPLTYSLISCPLVWPFIGEYIDNKGTTQYDLQELIEKIVSDFKTFVEDKDEVYNSYLDGQAFISRLPIMGCFLSKPVAK
jgi:hypothetical protein